MLKFSTDKTQFGKENLTSISLCSLLSSDPQNGPTYIVQAGNSYIVDKRFSVVDSNEYPATPSFGNFFDSGSDVEYNDEGEDFYDEDVEEEQEDDDKYMENPQEDYMENPQEENQGEGQEEEIEDQEQKVETKIKDDVGQIKNTTILNKTQQIIRVRMMNSSKGGTINLYPIAPGKFESWARVTHTKFLTEILTANDKSFRFYTKSNKVFIFDNDNKLIKQKNGKEAEATLEPFNYQIDPPKVETNQSIKVTNATDVCLKIRVQAKAGNGSEDVFRVEPGKSNEWKRMPGNYLIEISTEQDYGNYYIESNHAYTIQSVQSLVDNNTGQTINLASEEFPTNSINSSKKQEENMSSDNSQKYTNLEDSKDNCPYFQDIKPQFSKGQMFVDNNFPPEVRIILAKDQNGNPISSPFDEADENGNKEVKECLPTENLSFKRISEVFNNDFYLFKDIILKLETLNKVISEIVGFCVQLLPCHKDLN